ncbi:MAG: hypothetical protein ACK45I_02250 [Bacteroidota bacterium]|jgi:hypothetical protein
MKTTIARLAAATLLTGLAIAGVSSCKSKTTIQKETGAKEITVPFSTREYQSDKEHFRAKGSGNSPDMTTAKKIALQNAKSEMAGLITTTMKKVTEQYTNQRQVGNTQEFSNKFEEMAREVTNQQLVDVRIMDEKLFKEANNTFTYWVAVEANKQTVMNGIDRGIGQNQKLQQDYDKKKFEEIFNSEMDKLAKERGN